MKVTEAELRVIRGRLGIGSRLPVMAPAERPRPQYRSKAEAAWAQRLDALQRAGEIKRWAHEVITLRLGPDCRYTPDFLVVPWGWPVVPLELHEVKGKYAREDALVKLRAAAGAFPEFRFVLARLVGTTWEERQIRAE